MLASQSILSYVKYEVRIAIVLITSGKLKTVYVVAIQLFLNDTDISC